MGRRERVEEGRRDGEMKSEGHDSAATTGQEGEGALVVTDFSGIGWGVGGGGVDLRNDRWSHFVWLSGSAH